jgi:hypothetical protein
MEFIDKLRDKVSSFSLDFGQLCAFVIILAVVVAIVAMFANAIGRARNVKKSGRATRKRVEKVLRDREARVAKAAEGGEAEGSGEKESPSEEKEGEAEG